VASGPVSEFMRRISVSDICSDFRTLSGGQGLWCPWGVVTPTKKNISVPFELVQTRAWHALRIVDTHSDMSVKRDLTRIFDTIISDKYTC